MTSGFGRRATFVLLFSTAVNALPVTAAGVDSLLRERTPWNARPLPGEGRPVFLRSQRGRPLSSSPDSVIRDDFVCNDDVSGGCRQSVPAIAHAPDGSFVIAWYGFTAGETDIWFQRFDAEGRPLGENRMANGDSAMRWQGDPALAVAADASFLVTWEDRWQVGDSDIFARLFSPDGNELGPGFRVSDSGVPGDQMVSGAWTSPSGVTLVAWDDRRHGITGDIFARFFDPDLVPLDTGFMVNDDGIGVGNQYQPVVAGDDSGRFVVAWMDGRTGSWNVFGQRFGPARERLGPNFQVTDKDSWQWSPAVAMTRTGRFLVTWDDRRQGRWDVYARVYDAQGQPVGDGFRVPDDPGTAEHSAPAAAANGFDEFLVVWIDRREGYEQIRGRRYGHDGGALGAGFVVSEAIPAPAGRGAPAASAAPDGGYAVAWTDGRDGHLDIHARLLARDGTPRSAPFRVNTDSASSLQRVSSLDMYEDGRVFVAWEDERNGRADIHSALLAPDGRPLAANLRLNDDPAGVNPQYYAAVAAGRTRALATWTDGRDGFNIYGQFLDSAGQPAGANFMVNEAAGGHRWYSYAAMDDADRAFVVWRDTRDGGYRVFGRMFEPDGRPAGASFRVGDADTQELYASIAANSRGRFLVSWMDYRDGRRPDIYAQLYDSTGAKVGVNFRVNDDTANSYHGYPSCAVAADGGFAIAWEDTRNDNYDVCLQWYDADRNPLGANVRVNDGPPDAYAYSPSCAFDRQGRLVVLFNDERDQPRNPQVFAQRYRPDRSRISGNQRLNRPNAAPRNHHWTVGRSIAASDEVIAATWTGNRRLQGWDIYAKLTDWNLVGLAERPVPVPRRLVEVRPTVAGSGRFVVSSPTPDSDRTLRVLDKTGRVVYRDDRPASRFELDLGGRPGGVYFLELRSHTGTAGTAKLVIP
ncbi:MAG TPA: hypothetical protein ENN51_00075 [candidate division WOR-3 bacterium]|uniref:T9SS type A sorting domain-containing protein n=1 Tax=candidate division WOR-3 bacterium TaxID=2052148 RepID=A0A7V0T4A9_UNCW3|nr:hypothetical protein [candidate division WOR-3 bacterium]